MTIPYFLDLLRLIENAIIRGISKAYKKRR